MVPQSLAFTTVLLELRVRTDAYKRLLLSLVRSLAGHAAFHKAPSHEIIAAAMTAVEYLVEYLFPAGR